MVVGTKYHPRKPFTTYSNWTGWIKEIVEERDYSPYGGLILKNDAYPDKSWITFQTHIDLGGSLIVEPLEEKEAA